MASIMREQLIKINSKCGNGFELDLMYYINWGEKRFNARLEMGEDNVLSLTISYRKFREGLVPEIRAEYEKKCSDDGRFAMYSHQSGNWCKKFYIVDLIQKRKNVSVLQKITREMSAGFIDKLKEEYAETEKNGMLQYQTDLYTALAEEDRENITMKEVTA